MYSQTTGCLQGEKNSYCCLGIACKALIPQNELIFNSYNIIEGITPNSQPKSPKWLRLINKDFKEKTGVTLTRLNDSGISDNDFKYEQFTFSEIATLLELTYIYKILD